MDYRYILSATAVLLTFAIGYYIRWVEKCRRYWKDRGIPHVQSMEIISNLLQLFKKHFHEILIEQTQTLGRIYGSFDFGTPMLNISEPDLVRDILVKDFHIFYFRRDVVFGDDAIDKSVTVTKGEDWKRLRTIITPAFTSKKMRQMSHIIRDCTITANKNFGKYAETGEPADCKEIYGAFTMDVIASVAFGTKIDSHDDPNNIFVKNAKGTFIRPSWWRWFSFILMPTWLWKLSKIKVFPTVPFFRDVVVQVIKERRKTGKKYNDILQLFLDARDEVESETSNGTITTDETDQYGSIMSSEVIPRQKYKKLDEDELVAQCILFFAGGFETISSTLSFLAYSLALNPECQEKLITEVDEVFKKHEELDYDKIRDMKYLDGAVAETLRMYPVFSRTERTASEDYKLGNTGITIEKGTRIGINVHAMHVDPEFFPNPEKFDPERFMKENANHPQYAYLPFGAGPRNCLGMRFALMEIKLCISNVLRYYRFRKSEKTKIPPEYKLSQGISVDELYLSIEKRNK